MIYYVHFEDMCMKIIVLLFLGVILYCLASGVYYLVGHRSAASFKMAKALTWRIVLSLGLFILLFVAYLCGWLHPHGIYSQ